MKHKVVFLRYLKFKNSETKRMFPYEGESWWVIKSIHYRRFFKLLHDSNNDDKDFTNPKNWLIVNGEDMNYKEIYAIDYKLMNGYVMGQLNEIPKLLPLNLKIHTSDWTPCGMEIRGFSKYEIESMGFPYWYMNPKFQVLIIR